MALQERKVIGLEPGSDADSLGKAEDAAHATGDVGVQMLAVRANTAAATAADGDYVPLIVDATGHLWVRLGANSGVDIGDVDVTSLVAAQLPAALGQLAMAASMSVTVANNQSDVPVTLDSETVVLGAGTASIGKLAANTGVDIGDVDVTSLQADQLDPPSTTYNGLSTVAAPATAEVLASSQALESGVQIKAESDNTGIVYVGDSSVSAANGYYLLAGETVFLSIDDLAEVWLDVSVAGDGATYLGS